MSENRGILICGESDGEHLSVLTAELIHIGQTLDQMFKDRLSLILMGENLQTAAIEAISMGVDKVYTAAGPPINESSPERKTTAIAHLSGQIEPYLILFGQTDLGREIAPRVGAKLDTSVCLDCIALGTDKENGILLMTKPVYGGNAIAVWASDGPGPHIVSLRPRTVEPAVPDPSRKGEILSLAFEFEETEFGIRLLENVQDQVKGVKLEEAKVIVAGGGGIGGKEGFVQIEELANLLHGAVGISRVPCDEDWMPKSLEIGQTGHMVNPDLYIAVGISGAPQHMAGCSDSKVIVAINKDPDAPIFKEADFGVVGDYREALPVLIEKLKSYQGK